MSVTVRRESIGSALIDQRYALVDFNVEELQKKVFEGWQGFLSEPADYRASFTFGDPKDPDEGYIFRNGGVYDEKHFFHYSPHLWPLLKWRGTDYARYEGWLMECHELYLRCFWKASEVCLDIDLALPGRDFHGRMSDPRAQWKTRLRLLSYKQVQKEGEVLGKFHVDRAFITLHVAENFPGLNLDFGTEGEARLVAYSTIPGKILVFAGGKADAATDKKICGLRHGVIAPPGVPDGAERMSIVFFAHI